MFMVNVYGLQVLLILLVCWRVLFRVLDLGFRVVKKGFRVWYRPCSDQGKRLPVESDDHKSSTCDVWCVMCDVWCVMCDVWCVMCDGDEWGVRCDVCCGMHDKQRVIHDAWRVNNGLSHYACAIKCYTFQLARNIKCYTFHLSTRPCTVYTCDIKCYTYTCAIKCYILHVTLTLVPLNVTCYM